MDPGTAMLIGTGVNVIGGIFGGNKASAAAQQQAIAQNKATMARYQYDLNMWDMKKQQLQAQRSESVDRIMMEARNEGKLRAYKDVAAQEQYDYSLRIRNDQQTSNEIAFKRSDDIYRDTTDLNGIAARASMDSEIVKLEETAASSSFDKQQSYIESIQNEGKLRARGASGRSAAKNVQSTMADYGRQMAMMNETMASAGRNTRAVLNEIIRDKTSADLTAFASKMLDPGVLPMPIKQRAIPVSEFTLPKILEEYDFGPQPVKGAMASPGAAASMAWGNAITSIAGSIGGGMMGYAGTLN